ncbi:hypothetical protein CEJ90_15135 [Staphylococcus aureus]|nr:hypothetical protein CEJ90_15135 [Staphylococcus aureus]
MKEKVGGLRINQARIFKNLFYKLALIHLSEPQRLRRTSYGGFCLKKKKQPLTRTYLPSSFMYRNSL